MFSRALTDNTWTGYFLDYIISVLGSQNDNSLDRLFNLRQSFMKLCRDVELNMLNWSVVAEQSSALDSAQVLVLSECGFEFRPGRSRRLCPCARHLTIIASSFGWDVKL